MLYSADNRLKPVIEILLHRFGFTVDSHLIRLHIVIGVNSLLKLWMFRILILSFLSFKHNYSEIFCRSVFGSLFPLLCCVFLAPPLFSSAGVCCGLDRVS